MTLKYKPSKYLILLFTLSILAGCSSKVVVTSQVPTPLVEKLPLNATVIFTDEFQSYVYQESEKKRVLESLDLAQAQMDMFTKIFGALTNLVPADAADRHLAIEPEILDFQYSAPSETSLELYEVWIRYRIKLTGANDEDVADWVIKGYGKTSASLLGSASQAFNSAANVALRDVGAQLATRFARQRAIKKLLDNRNNTQVAVDTSDGTVNPNDAAEEENRNE